MQNQYKSVSSYKISNVITYNQYPLYPNGCEAVALYILLKYYNINISIDNIINTLPIGKNPYEENGIVYGGNPNIEFIGNPRSTQSWGIWDNGLANVANKYKSGIINATGMDLNNVYRLINKNRPVIVWTSINLKTPYISKTWINKETGDLITWKNYNHAVVIIGYTETDFIISDPINGQIRYMNKNVFTSIYNYMGKRIIYY